MNIVIFLLVGLIAGWIAGVIAKGRGFGIVGNLVVGVLGAVTGGLLFEAAGVEWSGLLGATLVAVVGALILLFLINALRKPAR